MSVGESWGQIETWLSANALGIRKTLRPVAKAGAVEKLQQQLGATLPTDFVESVRLHDGQKPDAEHGLFPVADDVLGAMPSCRLLSVKEIAREWAMLKKVYDGGNFADRKSEPGRGVRADWWNPGWVPIADNGGGDYCCIDLAPGKGGVVGQVIVYFNDMTERPKVAKSYGAWLEKLAKGFTSGKYVFDAEDGIVAV